MPWVSGPGHNSPPTPSHPPPMGWPFRLLDRLSPAAAKAQDCGPISSGEAPRSSFPLCVCGSHTVAVPLGGRVGHGVHRVYTGRLHTAVGNRHLWVLQRKREIGLRVSLDLTSPAPSIRSHTLTKLKHIFYIGVLIVYILFPFVFYLHYTSKSPSCGINKGFLKLLSSGLSLVMVGYMDIIFMVSSYHSINRDNFNHYHWTWYSQFEYTCMLVSTRMSPTFMK